MSVRHVSPTVAIRDGHHACARCGQDLGPAAGTWKDYARRRELPLPEAGGPAFDTGVPGIVLRQFACPRCAVLLDTETARPDDAPLVDRLEISGSD
jgi:acetone carboxylase gamma subunit